MGDDNFFKQAFKKPPQWKPQPTPRDPWNSLSELAMVRSFFYPDRSPLEPPKERHSTPYRDSSGKFVNTFSPPTFAERDVAFRATRGLVGQGDAGTTGFSYFKRPLQTSTPTISTPTKFVPENPENCRLKAIDIVQRIQALRGETSLPHAVIATTQLTAALVHAERTKLSFYEGDFDYVTKLSVESTLASALGRFVTGLVDRDIKIDVKIEKDQAKSTSRRKRKDGPSDMETSEVDLHTRMSNSMLSNAAQIGLPASFVELRHQITHETMPSIPQMKLMAFRALDWLWDKYWYNLDVEGDEWGMEERERLKWIQEEREKRAVEADRPANVISTDGQPYKEDMIMDV